MPNSNQIAKDAFAAIQGMYPNLKMDIDEGHTQLDLAMNIPAQPGLAFNIHLNLQNEDELHLSAGAFWNSWFPCTDSEIVEKYIDAVTGLISGEYRIREHLKRGQAFRAELQTLRNGQWQTISNWGTWSLPWLRKSFRIMQNEAPT